jgi:hypothetical protein
MVEGPMVWVFKVYMVSHGIPLPAAATATAEHTATTIHATGADELPTSHLPSAANNSQITNNLSNYDCFY